MSKNLVSVIKYEGDNETLVWKHTTEDFSFGSQLIVHESQEAVFFRNGQALDLFGPGRHTLETQKLPLMEKFYRLPAGPDEMFHSEIYYINMATQMGIKWGTDSKVRLFDPNSGMHIELGASGEFNIRVNNSRKLLVKLVGTTGGLKQDQLVGNGKSYFRSMIITNVKNFLAKVIKEQGINVLEIDEHLTSLSERLRCNINEALDEYGLVMPEFYVERIQFPDEADPRSESGRNFAAMRNQYAQRYLELQEEDNKKKIAAARAEREAVEAQAAAQIELIRAQGAAESLKVQKAAEAEVYKMQAAAEATEMQMKGYTYQQETARQVGLEAMKNGLTGGASGSAGGILGDVAGLGVALGAMGNVMDMTKEALAPASAKASEEMEQPLGMMQPETWECSCGKKGLTGRFCPDCGAKRMLEAAWNCSCGKKGLTGNFCENCGKKRGE